MRLSSTVLVIVAITACDCSTGRAAPMGVEISFATPVASAGIVWTDTASPFSGQTVTFEAFGPGMVSLGTIVGSSFGDNSSTGGAAHVSEDRVFAVADSMAGIIAIRISQSAGSSMELDHLLVGGAVSESLVPEPSTFTLLGIGCVALLGYGWRKRRAA